jgi:hypothetical protein
MKKIIATLFVTTVLSFTSNAQEVSKTNTTKTEITEASISRDVTDLSKTVTMNESLAKDFNTLLHMRAEAVNAAKLEEEKKAIFERYSRKLIGGLNDNQLTQLKANSDLYNRLTQYKTK